MTYSLIGVCDIGVGIFSGKKSQAWGEDVRVWEYGTWELDSFFLQNFLLAVSATRPSRPARREQDPSERPVAVNSREGWSPLP